MKVFSSLSWPWLGARSTREKSIVIKLVTMDTLRRRREYFGDYNVEKRRKDA